MRAAPLALLALLAACDRPAPPPSAPAPAPAPVPAPIPAPMSREDTSTRRDRAVALRDQAIALLEDGHAEQALAKVREAITIAPPSMMNALLALQQKATHPADSSARQRWRQPERVALLREQALELLEAWQPDEALRRLTRAMSLASPAEQNALVALMQVARRDQRDACCLTDACHAFDHRRYVAAIEALLPVDGSSRFDAEAALIRRDAARHLASPKARAPLLARVQELFADGDGGRAIGLLEASRSSATRDAERPLGERIRRVREHYHQARAHLERNERDQADEHWRAIVRRLDGEPDNQYYRWATDALLR